MILMCCHKFATPHNASLMCVSPVCFLCTEWSHSLTTILQELVSHYSNLTITEPHRHIKSIIRTLKHQPKPPSTKHPIWMMLRLALNYTTPNNYFARLGLPLGFNCIQTHTFLQRLYLSCSNEYGKLSRAIVNANNAKESFQLRT